MLSGQSVLFGPDRAGQNMLSGQSVLSGTDYTDKTNRASRATRALGCLEREGVAIPAQATRPGQALCCAGCTDRPAGCWQSVLSVPPGAQLDPTSNYVPHPLGPATHTSPIRATRSYPRLLARTAAKRESIDCATRVVRAIRATISPPWFACLCYPGYSRSPASTTSAHHDHHHGPPVLSATDRAR
jgi:hypothetical protein